MSFTSKSVQAFALASFSLPAFASDFTSVGVLLFFLPGMLFVCAVLGLSFYLPATRPWKIVTALVFGPVLAFCALNTISLFPRHAGLGLACLAPVLLSAFLLVKLLRRRPALHAGR